MKWPFKRTPVLQAPRSLITIRVNDHPVFLIKVQGLVEMESYAVEFDYDEEVNLTCTRVTKVFR